MGNVITPSGLLVPADALKKAHAVTKNGLIEYPHVRAFMPGQTEHFSHPKVGELNKLFGPINETTKQKLFAAWHEPNQALQPSGLFGVVIWATDPQNPEWALPKGNPCSEAVPGSKMARLGICKPDEILGWFRQLREMTEDLTSKVADRYDELFGVNARKKLVEERKEAFRQIAIPGAIEIATINAPSRTDRTISATGGETKEAARKRIKNRIAEELAKRDDLSIK